MHTLLQTQLSTAGEFVSIIATIVLFALAGAAVGLVGYAINRTQGDEFRWDEIRSTLAIGALAGVVVLVFGGEIDGQTIEPVMTLLIPLVDKIWNAIQRSGERAAAAQQAGESPGEVLTTFLNSMDQEVDQEQLMADLAAVSEAAGGDTNPSMENVRERADQTREDYETGGVESAWKGVYPDEDAYRQVDDPIDGSGE